MKYLLPIILFLASCTTPEYIVLKDDKGNIIHTATPQTFFNTPDKPSEWSFWYFVVCMFVVWLVWKEFKSIRWPKKNLSNPSTSKPTDSI